MAMASRRLLPPLTVAALLAMLAISAAVGVAAASPPPAPPPSKGVADQEGCQALDRSYDMDRLCVRPPELSDACCDVVLDAAAHGGLICLCEIAFTPEMAVSGYGAANILQWYAECGGTLRADTHVLHICGEGKSLVPL